MNKISPKTFNIAGPCNPNEHYMLPAVERIPDLSNLFLTKSYFVLHAPRQSGKTTAIKALVETINEEAKYYAFYCSFESLERISDLPTALASINNKLVEYMAESGLKPLSESFKGIPKFDPKDPLGLSASRLMEEIRPNIGNVISFTLGKICQKLDKDLLIFVDEIDTLAGDVLVSFLRQLREGYINRNTKPFPPFPRSIALVGMCNIHDYKDTVRPDSETLGTSSPFNIITEALTLCNFTLPEIKTLYEQHTTETGQIFEPDAIDKVMFWTDGQPWLVNALASDVIENQMNWDYSNPITDDHIDQAAEKIKLSMNVHIDSLMARLQEPRVKNVMTAVLTGSELDDNVSLEDIQYCLDIGLIKETEKDTYSPANRIYADVIVLLLTYKFQRNLSRKLPGRFVSSNGPNITELLKEFQLFWSENSDKMSNRFAYKECDAQFSLFGYMQHAFNGTVQLVKEFASGTGFVDLYAIFKKSRFPIELQMKWDSYSKPASLEQLLDYMDRCQAKEGWLVVFDRDSKKPWSEKITWKTENLPNDITVHVVGC